MARMVRKQIYLERHQAGRLKLAAKMHGVSESEFVRQAIDRRLGAGVKGLSPDPAARARAVAFMRSLQAQRPIPNRRRDWTRDELYIDKPPEDVVNQPAAVVVNEALDELAQALKASGVTQDDLLAPGHEIRGQSAQEHYGLVDDER